MIIFTDVYPYIKKRTKILDDYIKSSNIEGILSIHGTFADGLKKNVKYVSDVDMECFVRYNNNLKNINDFVIGFINLLLETDYYFGHYLVEADDRFMFDYIVKKNGKVYNYDSVVINDRFADLKKKKVITKSEYKQLSTLVKDQPNLVEIQLFELALEKYRMLSWDVDDIKKGFLIHRKKKFKFIDNLLQYPILMSYILEYDDNMYVPVDITFKFFEIEDGYPISIDYKGDDVMKLKYNTINMIKKYGNIYSITDQNTNIKAYHGIFKNYAQEKYLKILKRLRTLLSSHIYQTGNDVFNNTYEELKNNKHNIRVNKIRNNIGNIIYDPIISCLNQIKGRVDLIIILMKYKNQMEIKRLVIELLNDSTNTCQYETNQNIKNIFNIIKKKIYNDDKLINALTDYKSKLFIHLNYKVIDDLIGFYELLEPFLPFRLTLPLSKKYRT